MYDIYFFVFNLKFTANKTSSLLPTNIIFLSPSDIIMLYLFLCLLLVYQAAKRYERILLLRCGKQTIITETITGISKE